MCPIVTRQMEATEIGLPVSQYCVCSILFGMANKKFFAGANVEPIDPDLHKTVEENL